MKLSFTIFSFLLAVVLPAQLQAQQAQHVPGQLLVQIHQGADITVLEQDLGFFNGMKTDLQVVEEISPVMRAWLLSFDQTSIVERDMLMAVYQHDAVSIAQYNHIVESRAVPNDAGYASQWQYDNDGSNPGAVIDADIDAPEAWDITTGGLTTQGDEIVVCVVDEGFNPSHPDFGNNVWVNTDEIPGNSIDDDGNGYVDDVNGWNAYSNNGNIASGGSHGNPVSGIIGAQGNNNLGVSGVNWDVKVMMVRGSSGVESTVLTAYTYPLTERKLYNQTNGAQGAFVVSTNASFGVDFGQPADAPLWCAMYDSLGKYGIVSCGATINSNQNVDVIGDLPTACPSDYLISVTNMEWNDVKTTSAGYGATTIDLGSFGWNAWTLSLSGYGSFGGTSGATPHVAGAVALAYAAPCNDFIDLAKSDPAAAAIAARQYIFDGTDANASLAGITTTGGRQNLSLMLDELLLSCGVAPTCDAPSGLNSNVNSPTSATLNWSPEPTATQYQVQGRVVGTPNWKKRLIPTNSFTVNILTAATDYEWQVRALCGDGSITPWSAIATFSTPICVPYCPSSASNASEEWIESVDLGGLVNTSGSNGGYIDFGNSVGYSFQQGQTVGLTLTPGYSGTLYGEWFQIWMDYNGDGDYADAGELVYDAGATATAPVTGSFVIPSGAVVGNTGMRIAMAYNSAPVLCGTWTFGEVEDYCVSITPLREANNSNFEMNLIPNPASDFLQINVRTTVSANTKLVITDLSGRTVKEEKIQFEEGGNTVELNISDLASGSYLLNLNSDNFSRTSKIVVID